MEKKVIHLVARPAGMSIWVLQCFTGNGIQSKFNSAYDSTVGRNNHAKPTGPRNTEKSMLAFEPNSRRPDHVLLLSAYASH